MKNFISTLQNIWSIKELRDRILYTLLILLIFRFGSYVLLPGVDPVALKNAVGDGSSNDLLGLINVFTGGAFNNAAVFALGVMPYITASIIIQLMGYAVPYFQKLQQQEGESGRKKINQITRFLTLAITLVQGGGYLTYIYAQNAVSAAVSIELFYFANIIILSTGTIFAMWLGERITDNGIGNGVSLLIMVGIIAALPQAFASEFLLQFSNNPIFFVIEMVLLFLVIMASILIVQGVRHIPVQYAKHIAARGRGASSEAMQPQEKTIPIKVNAAGVMPIIFAQAIMFLPATVAQWFFTDSTTGEMTGGGIINALNDFTSPLYNVLYFVLVVGFTYVYTALVVNPQQYAEYLKRQNAFIPGVQPGQNTADFIDTITTRITLPGSIFLGLISIFPAFAVAFGVNTAFALFFGGTSLLILVGVVLDTLQQIDTYLLMQKYDGLTKSGKMQGRSSGRLQQIGADF